MKIKFEPEYFVYQFLWLFLLFPSAIPVICLLLLLFLGKKLRFIIDKNSLFLYLWGIIILLSIMLNLGKPYEVISRVWRDVTIGCVWLLSLTAYFSYKYYSVDLKRIKKYVMFDIAILLAISIAYLINPGLEIPMLGKTISQVEYSLLSSNGLRLRGFLDYATLNTTIVMTLIPITAILPIANYKKLLCSVLMFIPVYLSGSRIGMISMLVLIVVYFYVAIPRQYRKLLFTIVSIASVIFAMLYYKNILLFMDELFLSRSKSNNARTLMYQDSIREVFDQNLFFGAGSSIILTGRNWTGTHSQYISIFYRTGVIGSFLAFIGFGQLFLKTIAMSKEKLLVIGYIISILIFWIFETIDPYAIYLLLFLSNLGILSNPKNWQQYDKWRKEG